MFICLSLCNGSRTAEQFYVILHWRVLLRYVVIFQFWSSQIIITNILLEDMGPAYVSASI
jgi:hypothetical protein